MLERILFFPFWLDVLWESLDSVSISVSLSSSDSYCLYTSSNGVNGMFTAMSINFSNNSNYFWLSSTSWILVWFVLCCTLGTLNPRLYWLTLLISLRFPLCLVTLNIYLYFIFLCFMPMGGGANVLEIRVEGNGPPLLLLLKFWSSARICAPIKDILFKIIIIIINSSKLIKF